MKLFEQHSSDPKLNAQQNLAGRTHYVDDATLRYHKARILETHITDNGLLFALIESVALDMHNTSRGFRPVIFNIFGQIICPRNLDQCFKTRRAAEKGVWAVLDTINAKRLTLQAIREHKARFAAEMRDLGDKARAL